MATDADGRYRSTIVGDLRLPPGTGPRSPRRRERLPVLVELNLRFPGGLPAVREAFLGTWRTALDRLDLPVVPASGTPDLPDGLVPVTAKLFQCVLTRVQVHGLVDLDAGLAGAAGREPTIFRVWPDYVLEPQIDRSAPTVKADAAWRSYDATGRGVVWAVIDSGIQGTHGHLSRLEISAAARGEAPHGATGGLHRDFSHLVVFRNEPPRPDGAPAGDPLSDECGHGTHVAGIIAGSSTAAAECGPVSVASSEEPVDGGFVPRTRAGVLSGMAPDCELVSLKVMRLNQQGTAWVTSSSAVIRALDYLRTEVNVDAGLLRVHGVNMSLGCDWDPEDYAAGRSPLCQAVTQLVASGVVVVVSAGNSGSRRADGVSAVLGSITEPAHTEDCVAVGSTHRDAPHAFGVTWTSSKGPTLDGRAKPDLVAPGEWVTSAAVGRLATRRGLPADGTGGYAEESGTSMAAPHVSGVVAAFLSARPEFVGRPRRVKELLVACATDLGRERYAQGAGLVDLMRMLSTV